MPSYPSTLRLFSTSLLAASMLALSACGAEGTSSDSAPGSKSTLPAATPDTDQAPPGGEASPEGSAPTPDADLTGAQLKELLRTRGPATKAESCSPDEVSAELQGFDVAAGSRFSSIVVTNTSKRACSVEGIAGLGVRGDGGSTFTNTVEDGYLRSGEAAGRVRVAPGDSARALLQWTGNLAGNGAERASLLVVQLNKGQVPLRVEPRIVLPDYEEIPDIGMTTTLRLAPFEPAD